jgi:hypothetical protein
MGETDGVVKKTGRGDLLTVDYEVKQYATREQETWKKKQRSRRQFGLMKRD